KAEYHNITDMSNVEYQWSVEDDSLFQACGLTMAHAGKSVLLAWNKMYLLNFGFKIVKESVSVKMTRVRIPLPTEGSDIRNIFALKYNTVIHMSDGTIYCFGSFQKLLPVKWLTGVCCFAKINEEFCLIRKIDNQVLLQTYTDLPDLKQNRTTLLHSVDITYELNIFQNDGTQEKYSLTALKVSEMEQEFVNKLFGIIAVQRVYVFSVGGHVFALTSCLETDSKSYTIELFCVYAVAVKFIQILPSQNICIVILDNGSVDMWYISSILGIKQRKMHHTGTEWLDFDGPFDNGVLYYTDSEKVVQLTFEYNSRIDQCYVHTTAIAVPGIQTCVWLDHTKQLVCLSDNNIFYNIGFEAAMIKESSEVKFACDYLPITTECLQSTCQFFDAYTKLLNFLPESIRQEREKQNIVYAVKCTKTITKTIMASITFSRLIPVCNMYISTVATKEEVDCHGNFVNAIFHLSIGKSNYSLYRMHWQLWLWYDHAIFAYVIPANVPFYEKYRLMVAITKFGNEFNNFKIKLVALTKILSDVITVLVPVDVMHSDLTHSAIFRPPQHGENQLKKNNADIIIYNIRLSNQMTLSQIETLCNGIVNKNCLNVFFLDELLCLKTFQSLKENYLCATLKAGNASAIYHFKQHLFLN
ncbi:hypothetical protein KR018_011098, partial [Drosophila ironensis]